MSGIVAWLRLDGAPAADETFQRLMARAAYHGLDHSGSWTSGPIALGHHQLCTTPESEHERQPIASRDGSLHVTFDGRIDNRAELLPALALGPADQVTDARVLLAAYERWGLDCVEHMIGDFGFALWDARERRLLCARDPLGARPVFYTHYMGTLAVASGLRELAGSDCIPLVINEGMAGEFLTGALCSVSETLYQYAFRLPPGHRLVVDTRGLKVSRYWHPRNLAELRTTRREAAEHFRALLFEAVRCRTRSQHPIAAHLSGGLDSSSVVSILGALRANGALEQSFEAYSVTFPGKKCDETEYARHVAERYRVPWHRLTPATLSDDDFEALATRYLDFPGYPNGVLSYALVRRLKERQIRVVLTGIGGDDFFKAAPPAARLLDLLPRGQLATLARELRGFPWSSIVAATVRHLAARGLNRLQIQAPRHAMARRRLPPWLTPDFVRRTNLPERTLTLPPIPRGWTWSRALRMTAADAGVRVHPIENEDQVNADHHVETRHPFYDVRVVEFLLALPEELCATQMMRKLALREAMRGVLPEPIRQRRTKSYFSHTYNESLATDAVRRSFSRMGTSGTPDWIDGPRARAALDEALADRTWNNQSPLWGAYGIDVWWHMLQTRPTAEAPPAREDPPRHPPISEAHEALR